MRSNNGNLMHVTKFSDGFPSLIVDPRSVRQYP